MRTGTEREMDGMRDGIFRVWLMIGGWRLEDGGVWRRGLGFKRGWEEMRRRVGMEKRMRTKGASLITERIGLGEELC